MGRYTRNFHLEKKNAARFTRAAFSVFGEKVLKNAARFTRAAFSVFGEKVFCRHV